MQPAPQLSVLMTVYNRHKFLREAIDSILNQSFSDFELLVVDDGSTSSEVKEIVAEAEAQDSRVRVIAQDNMGLAGARNTGIKHARAPLIALMDDDDVSMKDRLWTQHAYMASNPECASVSTGMVFINERGKKTGSTKKRDAVIENPANPSFETCLQWVEKMNINPTAMFRKDALARVGGYRPWFRQIEDIDLTLRMMERERLCVLPDWLFLHRRYRDSSRLSQGGMPWDFYAAAVLSSHCRREGIDDPVEQGIAPEEMHSLLGAMPGFARRHMIWKARSSMRKYLRDGNKKKFGELWGKCRALAKDDKDAATLDRLRKRIALWKLRYLRMWALENGGRDPAA